MFQINFFAPIMLARGLMDELVAAKGAVVNVTSIAGSRVHPFAGAAYSTSKAALAALTREMAADFGPHGVRVNAISPGEIETSILSPGTEKLVAAHSAAPPGPAGGSGEGHLFPVHGQFELRERRGTAHQWRAACLTGICGPETIAAHALQAIDEATGAVVPPIYMSSTYARDENYAPQTAARTTSATATRRCGRPRRPSRRWRTGPAALLFASGMAAITTLLETVPQGAHVVAPDVMYYGTRDWLKRLEGLGRIRLTLFDPRAAGALESALQKGRPIWCGSKRRSTRPGT